MKIGFTGQDKIAELETIIEEQRQTIENYILAEKEWHEEKTQLLIRLDNYINKPIRINNVRGAGRKKRATEEQMARILELKNDGLSLKEIATILGKETGEHWSKSTINNIVNRRQ